MAFTNQWTGPAKQGQGPYKARVQTGAPGTDDAPDAQVVTAVLQFPDGTRSVAGVLRKDFWLPSNWPTNGWRPVYTTYGNKYATWRPYLPGTPGQQTAAQFDAMMNQGYVMFYLSGDLGDQGSSKQLPWPNGWWAHNPKGVWQEDVDNFTWGMQQLNGTSTQAAQVASGQPMQPMQQGQPVQMMPPPPPPGIPLIVKVLGAVLVVGVAAWALD